VRSAAQAGRFHVFVYAPHRERILRLRQRLEKGVDVEQRIRTVDGERAKYLQEYLGQELAQSPPLRPDDLVAGGEDETARIIQSAMMVRE
jgi:hypothetical protein